MSEAAPSFPPLSPDVDRIYELQRAAVDREPRSTAAERKQKIKSLEKAIIARRPEIREAMWLDFHKPAEEVDLTEVFTVATEARHTARNVGRWMKPQRARTPLSLIGSTSRIRWEPKGMVLIISPWNFPFNLTFGPLVTAIAAGNRVILKPSEMTPHSAACMKKIVSDLFSEDEVAVIEGDAEVARALLRKRFDHIFFTGSPRIGREVMRAAAEHLTPVTLELGAKSPVIIDRTANLRDAAKKLAWSKTMNAGQTCIAPDYVLVERSVRDAFLAEYDRQLRALFGSPEVLEQSNSYSRLVNRSHYDRLRRMIDGAVSGGASIRAGAPQPAGERYIPPTVLVDVKEDASVMKEEIFGPVLPVVTFDTIDEAVKAVRGREKPLVIYLFMRDRKKVERILAETSAGATLVNDTLSHFYQVYLPFGGVGESGVGKGHGRFGFEQFSNARPVLRQLTRFSMGELLYPPYTRVTKFFIEFAVRYL